MNEKLVTSRELSRRLEEAGVPQESEYYWALFSVGWGLIAKVNPNKNDAKEIYSAYLSGELGELLPEYIELESMNCKLAWHSYKLTRYDESIEWGCALECINNNCEHDFEQGNIERRNLFAPTEAEARGLMLEHLIKNKKENEQ